MTEAFVTLCTNDGYAKGALVLAHSLREANTTKKLHCLIAEQVSEPFRAQLGRAFDAVTAVDVLHSTDKANLELIGRPDLAPAFTKLHCWRLTQYSKAVFLDADTLVLKNVDELFERDEFSAAPDIGWPDFFNSGVFVYRPSEETYRALLHMAATQGSFDGADQGLLNAFFSGWRESAAAFRLPYIYNMTGGVFYSYAAAYKKLREDVKIVHFIGTSKPWMGGVSLQMPEFTAFWDSLFKKHVADTVPSGSVRACPHFGRASPTPGGQIPVQVTYTPPHPQPRPSQLLPLYREFPASPQLTKADGPSAPQAEEAGLPPAPRLSEAVPEEPTPSQSFLPQQSDSTFRESVPESDTNTLPSVHLEPSTAESCAAHAAPVEEVREESVEEKRSRWEEGKPDFSGKDAFAAIQEAIQKSLE